MTYRPHPMRIQRMRIKGWRMPEGAVYVGRPTKWGNPFISALAFKRWLETGDYHYFDLLTPRPHLDELNERRSAILSAANELRGKLLACWCGFGCECHADVLAEMANQ